MSWTRVYSDGFKDGQFWGTTIGFGAGLLASALTIAALEREPLALLLREYGVLFASLIPLLAAVSAYWLLRHQVQSRASREKEEDNRCTEAQRVALMPAVEDILHYVSRGFVVAYHLEKQSTSSEALQIYNDFDLPFNALARMRDAVSVGNPDLSRIVLGLNTRLQLVHASLKTEIERQNLQRLGVGNPPMTVSNYLTKELRDLHLLDLSSKAVMLFVRDQSDLRSIRMRSQAWLDWSISISINRQMEIEKLVNDYISRDPEIYPQLERRET